MESKKSQTSHLSALLKNSMYIQCTNVDEMWKKIFDPPHLH